MDRDEKNRWFEYFALHGERLERYVKSRIRRISAMDAEDIVGEVMLNIVSQADSHGPVENLAAYAYSSVRNKITDYQRRNARLLSLEAFVDDNTKLPLIAVLAGKDGDACGAAERRELLLRLSDAIDKLEPKQRAVFIATELGDQTFRELSDQWHEPVGTLLSRKCRAVKALREMLRDLHNETV
jgi:RNA polymerase sigma factor (sigma-70 family)